MAASDQGDGFKNAADSAGGFLKKRGCVFWVIVIVVVLVLVGQCAPSRAPDGQQAAQGAGGEAAGGSDVVAVPAREVTPEELRAAYDENEVAAKQEYGGQPLRVKGTVAGITLDLTDDPVVQLATAQRYQDVQAPMGKEAAGAAGKLKKGQKITLDCAGVTEVISTPILKDCRIVPD